MGEKARRALQTRLLLYLPAMVLVIYTRIRRAEFSGKPLKDGSNTRTETGVTSTGKIRNTWNGNTRRERMATGITTRTSDRKASDFYCCLT